ncbi:Pre-rRNA-processing protein fhl1 [Yamadazyma tenuis]|uniref:FHA domain-containing protein n=1 Tax=Candida tenuis (strain ATCC 10573 / BCRC 21748 / CBS 615 / JCM 9827 / NBRC 10315 / NRRL Y-1498 / VKM Y-70) TaxID=590646 RepID=G3B2E3_CANTC|nr:uncharacterized protein CANTEDRAFT_120455 [Yamadazyma tenuis ATCC 10573]EGV64655.1 hypothetical protein CANTEDRAFT_120455 [Yamadazyma tenuis ATCC 10573]WEJ97441.1 Pre-rRNA-processing protein fhl1 [Yamadazyma tenuis]
MSASVGDEMIDKDLSNPNVPLAGNLQTSNGSEHIKTHITSEINPKISFDLGSNKVIAIKKEPSHMSTASITSEAALGHNSSAEDKDLSKISAYARLDFDNYTFFVQTLQVILGRKSNDELLNGSQHSVDVHLSSKKAVSRRHAKIFYNFGTQRFELSILGRNGAFVDDLFIEKGMTIPLVDGTKIQIGDITFSFVLPSVEASHSKDASLSAKPFDPSDAISLRTSLYSNSNSNSPVRTNKNTNNEEQKKVTSKKSRSIPRRLSEARRKSLASATDDELNAILSELGVKTLDDIDDLDEQDPGLVDAQIRTILGTGPDNESAIIDDDDEDAQIDSGVLSSFQEGEEDELDQLVKQHNMDQGVNLDEAELSREDMSLSVIDEEIVNLAPLINAHHQENALKERSSSPNSGQYSNLQRNSPLMGRLATPRMGKPASIQPPASRVYGRTAPLNKNQAIDMRLANMNMGSQMPGFPTHLVAQGPGDYSLKLAQGNLMNQSFNKVYMPPRPPVPELLVPIHTIPKQPAASPEIIIDKITVGTNYPYPPVHIPKIIGKVGMVPTVPKKRKELAPKKPTKNIYTMNEIPEHYRTKPTLAFPVMIINVLKFKNDERGLTLNDIYEGVKEIYPYYKYCPDGWQSVVLHNVRLNKLFKSSQSIDNHLQSSPGQADANQDELEEEEERWNIDESFVQEKEKVRKKQQEIAAQRAKEAAIRAEELKQKQRLEMQQSISQNIVGRDFNSPYGLPLNSHAHLLSQSQLIAQLHHKNNQSGQKPKTIAEIASEIRRDGASSKTPMYFKPQAGESKSPDLGGSPTIKAQLAANRSQYSQSPPAVGASSPTSPELAANATAAKTSTSTSMNQDTKKSLTYLQKELFTLYKARKLSYNTATTTEIITKALATTIAQVNVIGSKAGVGNNALSFLVERAPQQVSKILDIALTKSIKEKQGLLSSRSNSRGATPGPSQLSSPKPAAAELAVASTSEIYKEADRLANKETSVEADDDKDKPVVAASLGKPPVFSLNGKSPEPLTRPLSGTSPVLSRPQTYTKPGGLSKPPQFMSNKPTRPGYGAKPGEKDDKSPEKATRPKRGLEDEAGANGSPSKSPRL